MASMTNNKNLPLSLAVWLAKDSYDYVSNPNYFSATTLLKPIKQIVLSKRVPPEENVPDVSDVVASRIGNALHDSIEQAWLSDYKHGLEVLGFSQNVIDRVYVNPESEEGLPDNAIIVYLEKRSIRKFKGFIIGGKFDLLAEGELQDFKSTKVFSYLKSSNDEDYKLQGSIYKWLNPDIVKKDTLRINYIFTDWLRSKTNQDPNYPRTQVLEKTFELYENEEIERFIEGKLNDYTRFKDSPESDMPACTEEELWRDPPKFKYYKDPNKKARATRVFDSMSEAALYMAQKGKGMGVIDEVGGTVRRCNYCPAFSVCTQKNEYIANGTLAPFE